MKRIIALLLAVVCGVCSMAFCVVDAAATEETVRQDMNYHEVVGRVNQMDAGFTRSSTGIDSKSITAKSSPRNDQGWQFYYINLAKYSTDAGGQDKVLDQYFLEYLDKSLANLRKNGGNTMIRCCYDWSGKEQYEPQSFELLLTHQAQLCSVFEKYPDVIAFVECGMIGCFGEMWGGKYSRSVYKAQVLHGWLYQLPEEITVNVRTATEYIYFVNESINGDGSVVPVVKVNEGKVAIDKNNFCKYPFYNTTFSRIGCYNDAMIQDGNDGGSFEGSRTNFMEWLGFKSRVTNYGGEFSGAREYRYLHECWLPYNAIPEFYMGHLSYYHGGNNAYAYTGEFKYQSTQSRTYGTVKEAELRKKEVDRNMEKYAGNMDYVSVVSEDDLTVTYITGGWSSATMTEEMFEVIGSKVKMTADLKDYFGVSVAQFFEDHVGYRIVVRDSYISGAVNKGGVLNVHGTVDNTGFANITRNKVTELVITDGKNTYTVATDIDARKWYSGQRSAYDVEIKLPASIPAGEYNVYMRVAGQAPDGTTNKENCVRFCNAGDFTYSVLGSDYSVGAAAVKIIYDSKVCGNLLGSFTVNDTEEPGADDSLKQVYTKFADVKNKHWAKEEIRKICIKGLMGGVATGKFDPEGIATRAQFVTILYRMEGQPDVSNVQTPLTDIKGWYNAAIKWAYSEGIVNGTSLTTFSPNTKLNRETFATMMYRYAKYKGENVEEVKGNLDQFIDASKISSWAKDALAWANGRGLIGGMTTTTIVPGGNATRAQMATILSRFLGL